ncbi:NAD(P)-dependent oxidoreductase [Knoellia sp. S7-12]|uniref:precorrin-2 dehydrogenase/sirohydrochlorin ferrochelatase family protein n=1 Tax=Knoellia sp. S7-12 TaxID=3126698 RepID=UPI003366B39E
MAADRHRDTVRVLDFPTPDRHVLVVGGGLVAAVRVDALAQSAHKVTVIAAHLCDDMFDLLAERRITWENRAPRPSDLDRVWLVHAATGDAALDALVCGWVEARRQWRLVSGGRRSRHSS